MLHRSAPVLVFTILLGLSGSARADVDPEPPKQDMPSDEDKSGGAGAGCSVEHTRLELAGLAALVLLISAAALRRRDAEAV